MIQWAAVFSCRKSPYIKQFSKYGVQKSSMIGFFYSIEGALLIFGFALPNKKIQKVRGNIKGLSIHRFAKQPQQKR